MCVCVWVCVNKLISDDSREKSVCETEKQFHAILWAVIAKDAFTSLVFVRGSVAVTVDHVGSDVWRVVMKFSSCSPEDGSYWHQQVGKMWSTKMGDKFPGYHSADTWRQTTIDSHVHTFYLESPTTTAAVCNLCNTLVYEPIPGKVTLPSASAVLHVR